MRFFRHILEQPFIAATGAAALLHSTWSLGTLFAGEQPQGLHLIGWIVPALLIAFALDVGQIATSAEIRRDGLTVSRGVTFFVFAVATYYLQWLYMAHHMPALALAPGIRASWGAAATLIRDSAVWVVPALMPLSTLLYTFSGKHEQQPNHSEQPTAPLVVVSAAPRQDVPALEVATMPQLTEGVVHIAECPACGWRKEYESSASARRAIATHQALHCKSLRPEIASANGNGNGKHQ